jgi:hypothetical protein
LISVAIPLPQLTVPEDHLQRVQMLQEGIHFLKQCLGKNKQTYGHQISKSILKIDVAIGAVERRRISLAIKRTNGSAKQLFKYSMPLSSKMKNHHLI